MESCLAPTGGRYSSGHSANQRDRSAEALGNAYQDLKFRDAQLIGSGTLTGRVPALDWLDSTSLQLIHRLHLGNTDTGEPLTREGMTLFKDQLWLLPEDGASRLLVFQLP